MCYSFPSLLPYSSMVLPSSDRPPCHKGKELVAVKLSFGFVNSYFLWTSLEQLHQLMQKIFHFARLKPTFSILHTHFTKHPHQFIYSTYLFNKIFIFFYYHLSHRPKTTHTATIIQPPNHRHQATQQPSHHPIQPSYHQWNSHTHSTKPPSSPSSTYPNPKIQKPIYQKDWGTAVKVKESEERRWPEQKWATTWATRSNLLIKQRDRRLEQQDRATSA